MKLREYLFDKKYLIFIYLFTALLTGIIIAMGEAENPLDTNGFYALEISLLFFIIYLLADFLLKRHHFKKISKISSKEGLDWVNSLPAPRNTEQRIYAELLQKLYHASNSRHEEFMQKNKEDIEFLTMWVHEIKTPIAASKLIIENNIDKPDEKALYSIEDEIDKIEDFVQMTLFYSRSGEFEKDYIINSCNIGKIVEESIKREYSGIRNKAIKLNIENLEFEIDTDEKWLSFIIKQVLDNAIKYSLPVGTIDIYMETDEKESILNIKDNGTGIKDEDLKRVFDKNFTGFNGRKLYSSTGIGLYLSQKLARKLGHNITIHSEFGHGTLVSIHFPKWNDYYSSAM